MQLLIKRGQQDLIQGVRFNLWAKFELTAEEHALIEKYSVQRAILHEGNPPRDLRKAAVLAVVLVVILFIPIGTIVRELFLTIFISLVLFGILTYILYHAIREEIRVRDIISGRYFICRSIITLLEKERNISEMAVAFRQFLEIMKTWGGREVIDIEPNQPPTLRVIEAPDVAA